MKKLFKYTLPVIALCALASCSEDTTSDSSTPIEPNAGKEMIAFSPQSKGITRAGTPTGFESSTKVIMRIKAQNGTGTAWEDYRYTQAIMTAAAQVKDDSCNTVWHLTGAHSHLSYVTSPTNYTRYWDDAFGRASKLTVYAVAVPNKTDASTLSDNILDHTIDGTNIKKVNATTNPNWYTINSSATENTKITWKVSKVQTADSMGVQDLAYSNNIREGVTGDNMKGRYHQAWGTSDWTKSMQLGRLAWQEKSSGSTVGKFDMGHLVFQHALTYLEFNLTEGDGFDNSANTDFLWTNTPTGSTQSFRLIGFPITGQLDLTKALNETDMWTPTTPTAGTDDIIQFKQTRTTDGKTKLTLEGYVIPGTSLQGQSSNLLVFEIDNAKYYVTGNQIATAITAVDATKTAEAAKTLAGKHYIINLTVSKKKVTNITAAVIPWEEVTANNVGNNNTYCSFSFEDRTTRYVETDAPKFNIYRAGISILNYIDNTTTANYAWETGYNTDGAATKAWDTDHWKTTNWYWKDNKTYYHFRAAGYTENASSTPTITLNTDTSTNPDTDYFTIAAGEIGGSTYKDYIWGAPFADVEDTYKIEYTSANGFNNSVTIGSNTVPQISKAIGATDDQIKMLLFHMTSQITVNLTTTTGDEKVVLHDGTNGTTVKIVNFLPTGKVLMGTGAVSADGTRNTSGVTMTTDATATGYIAGTSTTAAQFNNFTYGMVPQPLTYDTDKHIGLEITTPDGNKYYVRDLSTIKGSLTPTNLKNPYSGSAAAYVINEWYPHYKYTYNITLKKKGILDITAAILPWETVTGKNIDIDLEN